METHEFIKELTEAGMTERQAEAIACHQSQIINENLATNHYFELLRHDIELLRKELMLKLGSMIVASGVATIGIILGVMSVMLK